MTDKLSTWIAKELEQRGWSHRELARRAGISQTAVSQAISEERKVGWDFCAAIARPLDKTPEWVLRLAGLLPPESDPAPDEDQLLDTYRRLSSLEQQFLLRLLRASLGQPPLPPQVLSRQEAAVFPPDLVSPDMEAIIELASQLDVFERRLVYDYVCWRLVEQQQRRDSRGERHKSKEPRQEELDRVMEHLNLIIAIDEVDPLQVERIKDRLQRMLHEMQERQNEAVRQTQAVLPSTIR